MRLKTTIAECVGCSPNDIKERSWGACLNIVCCFLLAVQSIAHFAFATRWPKLRRLMNKVPWITMTARTIKGIVMTTGRTAKKRKPTSVLDELCRRHWLYDVILRRLPQHRVQFLLGFSSFVMRQLMPPRGIILCTHPPTVRSDVLEFDVPVPALSP